MAAIMTASVIRMMVTEDSAVDWSLFMIFSCSLMYIVWDYARLTFKKVWNDR